MEVIGFRELARPFESVEMLISQGLSVQNESSLIRLRTASYIVFSRLSFCCHNSL